ncbi:glycoprotein hormone alpha-2 [Etheostoma spectabile]|nr:glycoprotein hormone alpha-2 [Etheostoma spectabile]
MVSSVQDEKQSQAFPTIYPSCLEQTHTLTHTCQWTHLLCTPEAALSAPRLQILRAAVQMALCVTSHFCLLVLPVMSLLLLFCPIGWSYDGLTPGCYLHPFNVTIRSDRRGTCKGTHLVYACVGYCESSAFPSRYSVLVASNFTHNITSASRCCTISKDAKVKVRLDCPRGRHHDEIEILTAKACRCDMCRKSRY